MSGTHMASEMDEQPAMLARLGRRVEEIGEAVRSLTGTQVPGVAFLARGSSDNAALVGRYAVELSAGLPTCLLTPSLLTFYGRQPTGFAGWLVVALSQSGHTPEIVAVARGFQAVGASVVAVTNTPESELARTADLHIALDAGAELAVPATKTVTAQMLTVLAIASGLGSSELSCAAAERIPAAVDEILADTIATEELADRLAATTRLVVVGRGFCYPAALETALKLQETTGVLAHGFSSADFRHGPIAVCRPDTPAVLFAGAGPADDDTRGLRGELARRGATAALIGTGLEARISWPPLSNPAEVILATVRGQQLAWWLCCARGIDPDHPFGLTKVTLTH